MRVTQMMLLNTALENESNASARMAQLAQMASSGKRVSEPSDDPAAWSSIQQQNAQIGIVQARGTTAGRAAGDLNLAESTLDAANNLVVRAKSIAIEGANGTQDAASRANAAHEVTSLQQQLLALANTRGASGYLFGGTATQSPPFDATGAFHGNADATHVEIATGVLAVSNASGSDAFTSSGGTDVFAALSGLASALSSNNPTAVQASIGVLDAAASQVTAARVDAGLSADRLNSAATAMTNTVTQMQISVSNEADADAPSTLSNFQEAQTAFEAALQVNQQILSTAGAMSGRGG